MFQFLILVSLFINPSVQLISIHLDSLPDFALHWNSIPHFKTWSTKLQHDGHLVNIKDFKNTLDNSLYDILKADFTGSRNRLQKWWNFKQNITFINNSDELKQEIFWNNLMTQDISIALEISLKNPKSRPRLLIALDGCIDFGIKYQIDPSKYLASITGFDQFTGFSSCDRACPDAATTLISYWKTYNHDSSAKGLVVYSPKNLNPCSTAHLILIDGFKKIPISQYKNIDKLSTWSDGQMAFMVGKKSRLCALNVESAISEIPLRNRLAMRKTTEGGECESAIDSINPSLYRELYKNVLYQKQDDEEYSSNLILTDINWPSAHDIINHNLITDPSSNIFQKSCSSWYSIIPVENNVKIPILETEGPAVKNIYDLVHLAVKIAAVSPSLANQNKSLDSLILNVAELCEKCHMFPSVSHQSLFEAFENIQQSECKETIFGGLGQQTAEMVDQFRRMPVKLGKNNQRVLSKVFLKEQGISALYSERCRDNDVLIFDQEIIGDTEYIDDMGMFFSVKYTIKSDYSGSNQTDFIGNATWDFNTKTFSMKLNILNRDIQGLNVINAKIFRDHHVKVFENEIKTQFNLVCGYFHGMETENSSPLDAIFLSLGNLEMQQPKISIPLNYHFLPIDMHQVSRLYDRSIIAFLSSMSAITILKNSMNFEDFYSKKMMQSILSITDIKCKSNLMGVQSDIRMIYRNDILEIQPCLQDLLLQDKILGPHLLASHSRLDIFLASFTKIDEKILIIHGSYLKSGMSLLANALEYFRTKYGYPIIVIGEHEHSDLQIALSNLKVARNYSPLEILPNIYIPFSGDKKNSKIVNRDIFDQSLCLAPNKWTSNECLETNDYASWLRKQIPELHDDHLNSRTEFCVNDFFGSKIPMKFSINIGNMTVLSIDLNNISSRDLLSLQNSHLPNYFQSFDIILLQSVSTIDVSYAFNEFFLNNGRYSKNQKLIGGLQIFWKNSVTGIGCAHESFKNTHIMACLFESKNMHFAISNLEDDIKTYPLSNPVSDLDNQSAGIMKRVYSRLCLLQYDVQECMRYPFPIIFAGSWNNRLPLKISYSEYITDLEMIENEIIRNHKFVGTDLPADLSIKIAFPPEYVKAEAKDLLYSDYMKNGNVFNWISGPKEHKKKLWPFSSRSDSLILGDWVMSWTRESNPLIIKDSVRMDVSIGSNVCKGPKEGRCIMTDPPCSQFKAIKGVLFEP